MRLLILFVLFSFSMFSQVGIEKPDLVCSSPSYLLIKLTPNTPTNGIWKDSNGGNDYILSGGLFLSKLAKPDSTYLIYYIYNSGLDTLSQDFYVHKSPVVNLGSDTTMCEGNIILDAGNDAVSYVWSPSGSLENTIITNNTDVSYSVTITDSIGCTGYDRINVHHDLINIKSLIEHKIVCGSDSITIGVKDTVGFTHKWSGGETSREIVVDTTGIYIIEMEDSIGCLGVDSIYVSFNNGFELNVIDDTLHGGIRLDAMYTKMGRNFEYSWKDSDGYEISSHEEGVSFLNSGSYSVFIEDLLNCNIRDSVFVELNSLFFDVSDTLLCKGNVFELSLEDLCSDCSRLFPYRSNLYYTSSQVFDLIGYSNEHRNMFSYVGYRDTLIFNLDFIPPANKEIHNLDLCNSSASKISLNKGDGIINWNTGDASDSLEIELEEDPKSFWVEYINNDVCITRDSFYITPVACDSAFEISGFVFKDDNNNGQLDGAEKGVENVLVTLVGGLNSVTTDVNGKYTFFLYNSRIVDLAISIPNNWSFTSDSIQNISSFGNVPGSIHNVNFGINSSFTNPDLKLHIRSGVLRPGFKSHVSVSLCNEGSNTNQLSATVYADELVRFNYDYFTVDTTITYQINNDSVTFQIDNIEQNTCKRIYLKTTVEVGEQHLGKKACFSIKASYFGGISKKTKETCSIIRGAYDPNHKEISTGDGVINDDVEKVTYIVQFQNTGTDTAFNISIIDSINAAYFDLNSVNMIYSSHDYKLRVDSNGIFKWMFDNVLLVDSNTNEMLSHGTFMFEIDLIEGLIYKDTILNTVDIFFDYNSPVRTNKAKNYFGYPTHVFIKESYNVGNLLFPNPTNGMVQLDFVASAKSKEVAVFNINGKKIKTFTREIVMGSNKVKIDLFGIAPGVYLIIVPNNDISIPVVVK